MEIILRSKLTRRVAVALEVAALLAAVVWISKTYWAHRVAQRPSAQNLTLATKLDPGNASYHLRLGRLLQYSISDMDPQQALEHFRRAAELNPYDPRPWVELGAALEFQGKTAEAEASLYRADFMAPNLPAFQWAIGNFFLLHGNVDEAFRHFRIVLAGSSQYNQILFSTAWKASGDANKILEQLIPHQIGTEFAYLSYLLVQQRYSEARSVWKRIAGSAETFPPAQAAEYIDRMIGAQRPSEAYEAWTDLRKKGLIAATYEATSKNLLMNGAFEERVLNMGFDWRILPLEGVYAGLDQTIFHSASHSLFVQFPGKQNLEYRHVLQYVKVEPGRSYRLRGFMKAEGITTDCGPLLEVRDPYDTRALDAFTESLQGSSMGWIPVSVDFPTGPKTELIAVTVTRLPSRKLDNLIAGKVWVDDLSLTAVSTDTANTR
jgi:tetratricopeptide (TPR) repeat protein